MTTEPSVLLDVEDGVATVTIYHPSKANSLTPQMFNELGEVWDRVEADPTVNVAIITGHGDRHFCAGGNLGGLSQGGFKTEQDDEPLRHTPRLAGVTKPVIAAINGNAVGAGMAFATDCDIVLAAESTEFFDPHVTVGLVTGYACLRLAAVIPPLEALRLAVVGSTSRLSARRAHELGLVQEVLPDAAAVRARAAELAVTIAAQSPAAMRISLRLMRNMVEFGKDDVLREALIAARQHMDHPDSREGSLARLEGRAPVWAAAS